MAGEKKFTWHKIADSLEEISFSSNGLAQVEIADKSICIAKSNARLSACFAKCPHAGGILADGYLDPLGNIVCPVHRYKFSLQNGRNTSGEGYFLKIFPIEIREDGLFVGFEQNNLFNWLK
jgi:3-phenylpropionate/trans-cinnamate dioxygenase ferredoxin subunit